MKELKKVIGITSLSLFLLTLLSSLLLPSPSVLAENTANKNLQVTVPVSCNFSLTETTAHTASITPGTYVNNIGESNVKATCNDSNGFAIYAIGYSNEEYGNNTLINTTNSAQTIATGTATSGATSNWAMKLTSVTGTYEPIIVGSTGDLEKEQNTPDFSNYTSIPSTYTKVAYRNSNTDSITGANLKTSYATYITSDQYIGEYEGKVKYTLVHPYNGVAPVIPVSIAEATTMQEVNTCPATLTTGQVYTIKDSRDNQDYKVAKLADGKCWMVENLNIAGGTALSADDTDVTSAYISSFSTSNNLTKTGDTIVLPASSTSGFDTDNYSYVYNSGKKTNCGASGQYTPCYSYYSRDTATLGSGRNISTDNTDAPYSICPKGWRLPTSRTTSATNWQTESDFYVLAHQYGLDSTTSTSESDNGFYTQAGPGTTPNFLLAGSYNAGHYYDGGSYGAYWSSTSNSTTTYARDLSYSSSIVNSANNSYRRNGFSVRCIFRGGQ